MKTLLLTTAAWAGAFGYLCYLCLQPDEPFNFLPFLWMLVTLALQLALLIVSAIALARSESKRTPALCLMLPLGALLWFFTLGQGQFAAWRYEVESERQMAQIPLYEAALEQEKRSPGTLARSGYEYNVDDGPPWRVAFIQPGSLLDNYRAIVYDPTGQVMQANQFKPDWSNWDDPKLQTVKELFGGDMVWAKNLRGPWYLCGFT